MANLKQEFLEYLQFHVNKSIYVWGGQGQDLTSLTEKKIKNMETSEVNANRAVALWNKRKGIEGAKAFDCSGLGMYFFGNIKGMYGDMTANDMKNALCTPISRSQVQAGDMAFKCYSNGKAYHVGYVNDKGRVIEAKGRLYGVIEDSLSAGGWTHFGRPKFYGEDDEPKVAKKETTTKKETSTKTGGNCTVTTKVIKKGVKGEAVKSMQTLLIAKGFSCGEHGADGSCGGDTEKAIKAFQKATGLEVDGSCGAKTWNKLING